MDTSHHRTMKFKFLRQIFDADDDGFDSMLLTTIIGMVG